MKTALQCLSFLAQQYTMTFDGDGLVKEFSAKEATPDLVQEAALFMGFSAALDEVGPSDLSEQLSGDGRCYPFLARMESGNWVIVAGARREGGVMKVAVVDPATGSPMPAMRDRAEFASSWDGTALFVKPEMTHPLLRCFMLVARHHGVDLILDGLVHRYVLERDDPAPGRFTRIARENGFKVSERPLSWDGLDQMGEAFPVIGRLKGDSGDGAPVIICGVGETDAGRVVDVVDPSDPASGHQLMDQERFEREVGKKAWFVKRVFAMSDEDQPFGLRWFIPEFLRQKRVFMDIGLLAIMILVIALATPLFFQIVIDKVLVHYSFSTLHMLGIGLLAALVFDAGFTYLRGYLLLHGTSKIDIRVATRTLAKLVSLPMGFFDRASSGVLIKHMQQADKIRNFLSGKLFLTLLDSLALFVFVPVLFFYSWKLTALVLAFSLLIGLTILMLIPTFRRRLHELYAAEGERQSFLVETIQGMHTVKSLSLEPVQRKKWDEKAAQAVVMNFKVGKISITARSATSFLEKAMSLALIWWGVYLVFDGAMTVGALIAFRMLSGRVTSPLVQIVSLIHEYQETALSVEMLGAIMNQRSERDPSIRGLTPQIKGKIVFDRITFRYTPEGQPALDNVSVSIEPGQVIGVVGRSGSGKSTLTRLLQGLYPSQEGVVRVDGLDIRDIDLAHLRRSIGVVLQENFLFHGTVRENVCATKPSATFEEIVRCCRMSGADEFIERLPQGYDTVLEENAANLSGGQKQRLAIARALLTEPRILIFDEATSALDAESEEIIQDNLSRIARGRTMIIISHRLSMLVVADSIVVMEQGKIVDNAPHETLITRCKQYTDLWRSQNRHILNDRRQDTSRGGRRQA